MGTISSFLVKNITIVFFFYGLAFYSMGLLLILANRHRSKFRLARAIRPLAWFAILHGINEWMDMFQHVVELEVGLVVPAWYKWLQLAILILSFMMLLVFDLVLLSPKSTAYHKIGNAVSLMLIFLGANVWVVKQVYQLNPVDVMTATDVLARYLLAVPAAFFGAWALFEERKNLRRHQMPQFGKDLLISAIALLAYGAFGQLFVGKTFLFPSNYVNSEVFLSLFGFPVQLFRGVVAIVIAIYMVRVLNVFEIENRRELTSAQQEKLHTQRVSIETERRINREKERLNEELRMRTQELSVLLDVSNLLSLSIDAQEQNQKVLQYIVNSLSFPDGGLLILKDYQSETVTVNTAIGFVEKAESNGDVPYAVAQALGKRCMAEGNSICHHADGEQIVFDAQGTRDWTSCKNAIAPVIMLGLPLSTQKEIIGALVLAQTTNRKQRSPLVDEFNLALGISQQLGLSIENARLHQDVQRHEKVLSKLLHRVVGAQETERKRIARDLHDATGQSLTAIGLGLRGVESLVDKRLDTAKLHIQQLRQYNASAIRELRRIIADLRPSQLDDLGLDAALHWYAKHIQKEYEISVQLDIQYSAASLPADYETEIFRITQEALSNVTKHAAAESVMIRLTEHENYIELLVVDDGIGFSLSKVLHGTDTQKGWGLLGMKERAQLLGGHCIIESSPAQGTTVRVIIFKQHKEESNVEDKIITG